jgi:hypothetical protein
VRMAISAIFYPFTMRSPTHTGSPRAMLRI